jgi:hypothetical protein
MGSPMPPPGFFIIVKRLPEPRQFIQVIAGPRQIDITALAHIDRGRNLTTGGLHLGVCNPTLL